MSDQLDREALKKRVTAAHAMIRALCNQERHWMMSIPARPDYDPDLVISAALADVDALIEENERLTVVTDELRKRYGVMVSEDWDKLQPAERVQALCASLESHERGEVERLTAELAEARRLVHKFEMALDRADASSKLRRRECDEARKQLTEAREILWMNHGHTMMYGDDGEMQCGECLRVGDRLHDYKREPLPKLVRHVMKIQAEARKQCDTLAAALQGIADIKRRTPQGMWNGSSALEECIRKAQAALADRPAQEGTDGTI